LPSFKEKEAAKNKIEHEKLKPLYDEYLQFGGFPQVALAEGHEKKKGQLSEIFTSYMEKDVRSLASFRELGAFRDLMLLLMARIGSRLDISKLSSELGVSRETVYSYLYFLQMTYFLHLLPPFTKSIDREVGGAKKAYVCDTGLARCIGNASEGSLLENAVFLNIRKYGEIRYYQKRSGGEIDFLLPKQKIALEVKHKGDASDLSKLRRTAKTIGIKEAYVVSRSFASGEGFICASDI